MIAVDMDGIVTDFSYGFSKVVRDLTGGRAPLVYNYDEIRTWRWEPWYWPEGFTNELNEEAWARVGRDGSFWKNLKALYPDDLEDLRQLHDGRGVVFMTRRQGVYPWHQTVDWLERHGIYEPLLYVIRSGEEKHDLCHDMGVPVLIDDNPKTMEAARDAGMHVVTITYPYNESVKNVTRTGNLGDALRVATILHNLEVSSG